MATQADLARGFMDNEAPRRASNMQWVHGESVGTRYICGGHDGEECVLAEYHPINHVEIYVGYPNGFRMHRYDIRRQAQKIRRVLSHHNAPDTTHQVETRGAPPATDERDDVPVNSGRGTAAPIIE